MATEAFTFEGTPQRVQISGTSAASAAALGKGLFRFTATSACHITFAETPTAVADGTSHYLPANTPTNILIASATDKVAVIQDASGGHLYISPIDVVLA